MSRKLQAYYFGFDATGVDAIDLILEAVANAGHASHHTDIWAEGAPGESLADAIQHAAQAAAVELSQAVIAAKAEEREACYQEALDEAGRWMSDDSNRNESVACSRVAAAIRKRGEVNTAHKNSEG